MKFEIDGRSITIENIDPLCIINLLANKLDRKTFNEIVKSDFSIVVRPSKRPNFTTKEGDYTIVICKEDGEEHELSMPHRGAKAFYVLTLMCQKVVGGLPYKYFTNNRAAAAIEALYDKLYRSGGEQWVENCAADSHRLSVFRTQTKNAVEENLSLENALRYWCGFEDEKRTVGKNQLKLKKIRIPNNHIVFEDAPNSRVTFEDIMEQLPPLEDLFGFRNKNTERIRELRSAKQMMTSLIA